MAPIFDLKTPPLAAIHGGELQADGSPPKYVQQFSVQWLQLKTFPLAAIHGGEPQADGSGGPGTAPCKLLQVSRMRRAAHPSECARCGAGADCSATKHRSLQVSSVTPECTSSWHPPPSEQRYRATSLKKSPTRRTYRGRIATPQDLQGGGCVRLCWGLSVSGSGCRVQASG